MDYNRQKLEEIERDIKELQIKEVTLKWKQSKNTITEAEELELAIAKERLAELKADKEFWKSQIDKSNNGEANKRTKLNEDVWLVTGSVKNALTTKGVRSRLYRMADLNLGYYDLSHPQALYYQDKTLLVHVLFTDRKDALRFESELLNEAITVNSALNSLEVTSAVSQPDPAPAIGQRIYFRDYKPEDTESPQETISHITSQVTVLELTSDEFRYQRIESLACFGSAIKTESAHIMSKEHCLKHESYRKYAADKSNILALSRDFHGFYDALNTETPLFNLKFIDSSEYPETDGRYRVNLEMQ
ncbi:hypothetical protein HDU91_004390, partial [Kappamyces sp. JEL0680]